MTIINHNNILDDWDTFKQYSADDSHSVNFVITFWSLSHTLHCFIVHLTKKKTLTEVTCMGI